MRPWRGVSRTRRTISSESSESAVGYVGLLRSPRVDGAVRSSLQCLVPGYRLARRAVSHVEDYCMRLLEAFRVICTPYALHCASSHERSQGSDTRSRSVSLWHMHDCTEMKHKTYNDRYRVRSKSDNDSAIGRWPSYNDTNV